jgi:inorganic pyrophosphatase
MGVPTYYRSRPHPWHGLPAGPDAPSVVNAFIEITPFDVVKYEIEKTSGYLRVDRPQRFSSTPPTLYGFVPRTLCAGAVADLFGRHDPKATARVAAIRAGGHVFEADGDPLDVCVVSERPVDRSEIIAEAVVVGGLTMLDGGTADDKIVAVLKDDAVWGNVRELRDLPPALVERLVHYFATYKMRPGHPSAAEVLGTYDQAHAHAVIRAAMADYDRAIGSVLVQ